MFTPLRMLCSALALLAADAAVAQDAPVESREPVYLEADELVEDRRDGVYVARGDVRMRSGNRVLIAREIVYDPAIGRVTARGGVEIYEGDQPAQLADEIVLDDALSEGVARSFATMLENNGRAAAAHALRRPDGSVELSSAYYTACELCESGEGTPTWRLRASRVVRDRDAQMIYYRDARLEILGAPVFYAPVFSHPDPSTPRRSGLLMPRIDISNRLGFVYQQPYVWIISPSQDLTIAPQLMTEANPLLELEYRKRFYSGELRVETSFTYEREFDEDGFFGEEEPRGHIFAVGDFDINDQWRWGFGAQAATEDLYLRRYSYEEEPVAYRSFYTADKRRLISQLYVQGKGDRFYADIAAARITSLVEREDDDTLPMIAPLSRFNIDLPFPDWAGRLDGGLSTVGLRREDGDDYIRASADIEWARPTVLPGGLRLEPFALGRVDAYSVTETDQAGVELDTRNFTRAMGAAGAELSWPFVRRASWGDVVIAPTVNLAAASELADDRIAPNVDSLVVELDRSNLFSRNRAAGYDVWEEGVRLDVGVSAEMESPGGGLPSVEVFGGRSHRLDGDPAFSAGSGLFEEDSDWIAEMKVDFGYLETGARTRLDSEDASINRLDLSTRLDVWRISADADYTRLADDAVFGGDGREELRFSAAFEVRESWSVSYSVTRDLANDISRQVQAAVIYRDECTDFRIVYERDDFDIGNLGPSESVQLQLTLFTLGSVDGD